MKKTIAGFLVALTIFTLVVQIARAFAESPSPTPTPINKSAENLAGLTRQEFIRIQGILDKLVTSQTITSAQEKAILAAIIPTTKSASSRPSHSPIPTFSSNSARPILPLATRIGVNTPDRVAVITNVLGISIDDLKKSVADRKTLTLLAGSKISTLISALSAFDTAQIDSALASGKITTQTSTRLKKNLTRRIASEVTRFAHIANAR
jgi:hypothetical protein